MSKESICFAKTKTNAIIPSKRDEDVGFDLYACFDEDNFVIPPFESKLVPTGIASVFSSDWGMLFRERGSTGIKNIKVNAGVVDSGYRSEIFVCLYNANSKAVVITKEADTSLLSEDFIIYPYAKAIAQAIIVPIPKLDVKELDYDELLKISSERGTGSLGSTDK